MCWTPSPSSRAGVEGTTSLHSTQGVGIGVGVEVGRVQGETCHFVFHTSNELLLYICTCSKVGSSLVPRQSAIISVGGPGDEARLGGSACTPLGAVV